MASLLLSYLSLTSIVIFFLTDHIDGLYPGQVSFIPLDWYSTWEVVFNSLAFFIPIPLSSMAQLTIFLLCEKSIIQHTRISIHISQSVPDGILDDRLQEHRGYLDSILIYFLVHG